MAWVSELLEVPARAPLAAQGTPGGEMERMHSQLRSMLAGASQAERQYDHVRHRFAQGYGGLQASDA